MSRLKQRALGLVQRTGRIVPRMSLVNIGVRVRSSCSFSPVLTYASLNPSVFSCTEHSLSSLSTSKAKGHAFVEILTCRALLANEIGSEVAEISCLE